MLVTSTPATRPCSELTKFSRWVRRDVRAVDRLLRGAECALRRGLAERRHDDRIELTSRRGASVTLITFSVPTVAFLRAVPIERYWRTSPGATRMLYVPAAAVGDALGRSLDDDRDARHCGALLVGHFAGHGLLLR